LRFPAANNTASWTQLNDHLHEALRDRPLNTNISADEAWVNSAIYDCLAQRCDAVKPSAKPKREHKRAREMRRIRAQKRELRSAWKAARKSGASDVHTARSTYFRLVRLHNKLRLTEVEHEERKVAAAAEDRFRKNPYKFGRELLREESAQHAEPSFTQADAEAHFTKTYADADRDKPFPDLPGLERVAPPACAFDTSRLTRAEFDAVLKSKSNASAPGMNGIPYLVYKRCSHAADQLFRLNCNAMKTGKTPHAWGSACVILLAKSAKTDTPADFRPIALGNADGKVFFTLVQRRLTKYMLDNKYLDRSVQKGFIPRTAGCVDHATLLHSALRNARDHHRSICVSWLDLANAYGSVRHSLVRYALEFYHLPAAFVNMIMAYYDSLVAMVSTTSWQTVFFRYAIGVFQGCTLSTILFDIVFNLLFEFLKSCPVAPFALKEFGISVRELLYADDITFVTGGNYPARDNQRLITHACDWLAWSGTMKFKPPKCRCLALHFAHKPHRYVQYDPQLQIDDHMLVPLGDEPFKMLGRKLYADLSEVYLQKTVEADLGKWMAAIDATPLAGAKKAWLYEHCVLARLTWPFIVYDFCVTLSDRLTALCTRYIKAWLRLPHSVTPHMLYLQKQQPGALGLRAVSAFFKQMQTVRASLLKYSLDPRMVELYAALVQHDLERVRWKATKCLEKAERDIACDRMCESGQDTRHGVGYFPRKRPPAAGTHGARREISMRIAYDLDQLRRVHLHGLAMQGAMLSWDAVCAQDMSWQRLMYGLSSSLLSFALKLNVNMLPTPDNLFRWRKGTHSCALCGQAKVTPGHILSSCPVALRQGRFTYRHDQVLAVLHAAICKKAASVKSAPAQRSAPSPIKFLRAGEAPPRKRKEAPASLIDAAADWNILADLAGVKYAFPLAAAVTEKRPDLVLHSPATRRLVMVELTVPDESRVVISQQLKRERYASLVSECQASGYNTTLLTVEVGVRGHVATQSTRELKKLGIWSRALHTDLSNAAVRGSYAIYVHRKDRQWSWDLAVHGVPSGAVPSQ